MRWALRILIIKGQSQYGGVRFFADCAAGAFRRQRHEVDVLDLGHVADGGPPIVRHAQTAGRFDLVFSINILGGFKDGAGRTLRDLYGGPHILWCTDYVLNEVERLRHTPKSTGLLLVDPSQVRAVRSIYGDNRFDFLDFFPHPAAGDAALDDASVSEFIERRPIQVLWAGSFQTPGRPWADAEGPARQVFQDAFDLAISVEWMPPNVALDEVLKSRGVDLADPAFVSARESASLIDTEVRKTRRFEFLKAVAGAGLPLHICGVNWESQLYRFKNVVFEGPVEMPRLMELTAKSRLVLNTNGNFGEGSHERPFSASLAGAATFSDWSAYYGRVFRPSKNIELFFWKDLDQGMASLVALANDPERCWQYACSAKATTLAGHTWDRRIHHVIDAADVLRGRVDEIDPT